MNGSINSRAKPKNVVFLVVDSLRYDHLGIAGRQPSPSPFLDELLTSGLCLNNLFAVGAPTDFAYPGLLASALPLGQGGYDYGISRRERSLAEVFQGAGYRTGLFLHDNFNSSFSGDRGYGDVFTLYDLNRFPARLRVEFKHYSKLLAADAGAASRCVDELSRNLREYLEDALRYCATMLAQLKAGYLDDSKMLCNYDYAAISQTVEEGLRQFSSSPPDFVLGWLKGDPKVTVFDEVQAAVRRRQDRKGEPNIDRLTRGLLVRCGLTMLGDSLAGNGNHKAMRRLLGRLRDGQHKSVNYASAGYLYHKFNRWVDALPGEPFLAWLHTGDVHDLNFTTYDLAGAEGLVHEELAAINQLRRQMSRVKVGGRGNPLYDFSIRYADLQIARLVESLKKRGIWNDTVLVITADHGHNSPCWPQREKIHLTTHFYDELYHVPAALVNRDIPARRLNGLFSAMDLGPTLLHLVGLPVPPSFEGMVIDGENFAGRPYLIMEHLGPGPCDLAHRPANICVRTKTHKLVYEAPPPSLARPGRPREFYDLAADPQEMHNLAERVPAPPELPGLVAVARKRAETIHREAGLILGK